MASTSIEEARRRARTAAPSTLRAWQAEGGADLRRLAEEELARRAAEQSRMSALTGVVEP